MFVQANTLAQAELGLVSPEEKRKPKVSVEVSEELDKEFERRRDWEAFYKDLDPDQLQDPYD